jgi:hypothetical protein
MAIVLRDILVTIEEGNHRFNNPVTLTNEASDTIGYAELEHRSDRLYASLHLEKDDTEYLDAYPKVVVNEAGTSIQSIVLSQHPNEDIRIEKIKDQELFQSSSGADHADMQ